MEHTRFVGLDIHKERISIAVAESGRSGAVEYLGEISNDPDAIGKLCDRLRRPGKTLAFCYEAGPWPESAAILPPKDACRYSRPSAVLGHLPAPTSRTTCAPGAKYRPED